MHPRICSPSLTATLIIANLFRVGADENRALSLLFRQGQGHPPKTLTPTMSQEDWFQMAAEAADLMLKKKTQIPASVLKIRMKMLNPNFDEKKLNFSH